MNLLIKNTKKKSKQKIFKTIKRAKKVMKLMINLFLKKQIITNIYIPHTKIMYFMSMKLTIPTKIIINYQQSIKVISIIILRINLIKKAFIKDLFHFLKMNKLILKVAVKVIVNLMKKYLKIRMKMMRILL